MERESRRDRARWHGWFVAAPLAAVATAMPVVMPRRRDVRFIPPGAATGGAGCRVLRPEHPTVNGHVEVPAGGREKSPLLGAFSEAGSGVVSSFRAGLFMR